MRIRRGGEGGGRNTRVDFGGKSSGAGRFADRSVWLCVLVTGVHPRRSAPGIIIETRLVRIGDPHPPECVIFITRGEQAT